MSKKIRNRLIGATAIFVVIVVFAVAISNGLPEKGQAKPSFSGLGNLIADHSSEENPYVIVEVVPDKRLAKLGYLVDGSEPYYYDEQEDSLGGWESGLVKQADSAARKSYMNSLNSTLTALIGSSRALSYTEYQESVVAVDGYQMLSLAQKERLAKGTKGVGIVPKDGGDYAYDSSYEIAEPDDTGYHGTLDQNVRYYDVAADNRYYDVGFAAADPEMVISGGAYVVSDVSEIGSWDAFQKAKDIYYKDETDNKTYIRLSQEELEELGETAFEERVYYELVFKYTEATSNTEEVYYLPDLHSIRFSTDASAQYGAVLNEDEPYIENPDSNGHFTMTGENAYVYVGEGKGDFTLELGVKYELEADVMLDHIYYTGGFSNNNRLLEKVFNKDGTGGNVKLQVKTVTPAELTKNIINDADMIFLSDSSAYYSGEFKEYGKDNDLTTEAAYAIYTFAETNQLPVMLEHTILSRTAAKYLYKTAVMLEAQDLTGYIGADYDTFMDYEASEFVTITDADNHFVNGNVYVIPGDGKFKLLANISKVLCDGTGKSEEDFSAAAYDVGFGEIADMINSENFIRKTENNATHAGYEMFEQKIFVSTAIEYIISYVNKREEYSIDTLHVLDIEPYPYTLKRDWMSRTEENKLKTEMAERIKLLLGAPEDITVEITHKSMAEFEGTVEDLCKYDVIYMGLQIDAETQNPSPQIVTEKDQNGNDIQVTRTNFRDDDMDGLMYSNIGDIFSEDASTGGILDTDYNYPSLGAYTAQYYNGENTLYNGKSIQGKNVRMAGNDITDEKLHALQRVANAGTPIILADNFLTTYGTSTEKVVYDYGHDDNWNKDTTKNGYIDNCSKMYTLIDSIKDYPNIFLEGDLVSDDGIVYSSKQNLLIRYAMLGKPVLTMKTAAPVEGENYVMANGDQIEIDFSIANYGSANANATFDCILYADYNADGRYSDVTERIEATDYRVTLNGKKQESVLKTFTDSKGNEFESYCYELTPSSDKQMYHLEYNVSGELGLLPVKLKITQSTNSNRYDSDTVYFYHPLQGEEREQIRVLQILPEHVYGATMFDMDLTPSSENEFYQKYGAECNIEKYKILQNGVLVYRNPKDYIKNGRDSSLEDTEENYGPQWEYLMGRFANSVFNLHISDEMLPDYSINIDSVFGADYGTVYAMHPDCLDDYDMLVIGFADCYDYHNYIPGEWNQETIQANRDWAENAYKGIHEFITLGKSVLFTHDTTSGYGAADVTNGWNSSSWGAFTNEYIVPDVGMERYGAYSNLILRAGLSDITVDDKTTKYTVSDYASLKKLKELKGLSKSTYTSAQLYGMIVDYAKENSLDVGYKPNSDKKALVREVQGYSDPYLNGAVHSSKTSKADMINEGQILVYPYNLLTDEVNTEYEYVDETGGTLLKQLGEMRVARTHCQYFQLDMNADEDGDGESDTTVWFTLAGGGYDKTYKEARNNYYIYTRGNITYSGVGHSNISPLNSDSGKYLPELKLYINTMITSFKAGNRKPTVTVKQGDSASSADLSTIYVGTDYHIYGEQDVDAKGDTGTEGEIDYDYYDDPEDAKLDKPNETETIYFYATDTNRVSKGKKKIAVDYYILCDSESQAKKKAGSGDTVVNLGTGAKPQYAVWKKSWKTYESNAKDEVSNARDLKSGKMYSLKMPYSVLEDDEESVKIRISVTTTIEVEGVGKTDLEGHEDVMVQRTGLFDLE